MPDLNAYVYGRTSGRIALGQSTTFIATVLSENAYVLADVATTVLGNTGEVAFMANAQHASVTKYRLNLRAYESETILLSVDVGKPTPDGNRVCLVDPTDYDADFYSQQEDGNYSMSVEAFIGSTSTDSTERYAFSLPLA